MVWPLSDGITDFVKLYDKYNKDGLEIVGITIRRGESIKDVAKFQDQWGLNYLLLNDIKEMRFQKLPWHIVRQ
ncbi:MAG: hypothetical protein CM1200mP10_14010 [Candidatus Neomarinimicrobiota bacterium]|nr:MAG: hypothetical protein CM1200mP10_14010 [Candidatus Neomarinimicrobiota bacterium]